MYPWSAISSRVVTSASSVDTESSVSNESTTTSSPCGPTVGSRAWLAAIGEATIEAEGVETWAEMDAGTVIAASDPAMVRTASLRVMRMTG